MLNQEQYDIRLIGLIKPVDLAGNLFDYSPLIDEAELMQTEYKSLLDEISINGGKLYNPEVVVSK